MSRAHLLEISQRVSTYKVYDKFKSLSIQQRKSIRIFLKIFIRIKTRFPIELWRMILEYISSSKSETFGQIIDILPHNVTKCEYISLLQKTLMNSNTFERNPLLYSLNSDDAFKVGQFISYNTQKFLCYPSLYVEAFYNGYKNNGTSIEYTIKFRGELFIEIGRAAGRERV